MKTIGAVLLSFVIALPLFAQSSLSPTYQQQIDAGRKRIVLPEGEWTLARPLNLRGKAGLHVMAAGCKLLAAFAPSDEDPPPESWPVVDMTDARECRVEMLAVGVLSGASVVRPAVGILLARSTPNTGADMNVLDQVRIDGPFSMACIYSIGAEVNEARSCTLQTRRSGAIGLYTGSWNAQNVRSPFGPVAGGTTAGGSGAISNVMPWRLVSCHIGLATEIGFGSGREACVVIGGRTIRFIIEGCSFSAKAGPVPPSQAQAMLSGVWIAGATGQQIEDVSILRSHFECLGARFGIRIDGPATNVTIEDNSFTVAERSIEIIGPVADLRVESNDHQRPTAGYQWQALSVVVNRDSP